MKQPRYIWLSLIGFVGLFLTIGLDFSRIKRPMGTWLRFIGKIFILWIGVFMIPTAFLVRFRNQMIMAGTTLASGMNVFIFIFVYLAGVFITSNLYRWHALHPEL